MADPNQDDLPIEFNEANIKRLKEKYSQEMKDSPENPIKTCIKLIFDSAIEKNPTRRNELSMELSSFLTNSNGIMSLFLALIDFDTSSQKVTTHNQRFTALANIIACLPKLCMPFDQYAEIIFKQLMPILVYKDSRYSNLACIIIRSLLESPHSTGEQDISSRLLKPVLAPILSAKVDSSLTTYKPEDSIVALHNLIENHVPSELFVDVFPNLYYALVILKDTPSCLKSPLKSSLMTILKNLPTGVACCLIENTLFFREELATKYDRHISADGVTLRIVEEQDEDSICSLTGTQEQVMTELLEECDNQMLILEFFFHFQETMWVATDDKRRLKSAALIEPLLNQTVQEDSTKLDLFTIIANNIDRSLNLISRTLLNYISFLRTNPMRDSSEAHKMINQSLDSCLNIIEVLTATAHEKPDLDMIQRNCLPALKEILTLMTNATNNEHQQNSSTRQSLVSLVDRLGSMPTATSNINSTDKPKTVVETKEYDAIIRDLNNKSVPIRVHGLVRLKQMIMTNNKYAISQIPILIPMMESLLADEEPYVFLATINVMVEMSVRRTQETLPRLIQVHSNKELALQQRLNAGEVMVRLTKQMHSMTPHYAQQVMGAFIVGCKSTEELIRMSSLTNIGEICANLGDSLGKYIVEILAIVEQALEHDTLEVKCAAIDLLRTLLAGLDKYRVESIQRELKLLYGLIKRLRGRSLDDKLCLQVTLALEEMSRLAKELLGLDISDSSELRRRNELVKNIKVLSL